MGAAHTAVGGLQYYLSAPVIGTAVALLLTLAIFSFLYSDNRLYKFAEHLFVGVSAAYGVALTYQQAVVPLIIDPLFRPERTEDKTVHYLVIAPTILGLMMFSRFVRRYDWLSRWPIAFAMGIGAGLAIPASVQTSLLPQLHGTMAPLVPLVAGKVDFMAGIDNLLLFVGVVCVLIYFYFSMEHKGVFGAASKVGVWFLMVAFGAGFGNTVMARISLLIGRIQFLRFDVPRVFFPHGH